MADYNYSSLRLTDKVTLLSVVPVGLHLQSLGLDGSLWANLNYVSPSAITLVNVLLDMAT